jgi:choline dehydrogenase
MEHDYVIAGAGAAGCALAARLTEDPGTTVLLLEAGPRDRHPMVSVPAGFSKLFKTELDWNYATAPQAAMGGRELYWPRGKTLGGSSSINAQMWVRGNRRDYDGWAALGNAGWSFEDVLPLFLRIEDSERGSPPLRGTGGPVHVAELRDPNPATHAFVEAAREIGIPRSADVNGPEQDGVDYVQVTQRRGRRWSASNAYLRPAGRRPNLTVLTEARVTRVVLQGARATGLEVVRQGRREMAHARAEVILAGGSVNSPQLLMLSGIGPADHLRALGIPVALDLPGVGRNLQDHLVAGIVVGCPRPCTLAGAQSAPNLLRYLFLRRGPLTSNVAEGLAFVRLEAGAPAPDLELLFAPAPFVDHGLSAPPGHGISIGAVLQQPRSAGAVTLRSADPLEAPRIEPAYLSDPEGRDLRLLVEGLKLARELLHTRALAPFVGDPMLPRDLALREPELAAHVRERAETLYHPVGTCKMGVDDLAVVDPELHVRGVSGLRVVDASVLPRIIRGHTQAPAFLVAERAADLVTGRFVPRRERHTPSAARATLEEQPGAM